MLIEPLLSVPYIFETMTTGNNVPLLQSNRTSISVNVFDLYYSNGLHDETHVTTATSAVGHRIYAIAICHCY
jgi:hypothetical protein